MTQLILRIIHIVALAALYDALQRLNLLRALVLHAECHGTLILRIVTLRATHRNALVVARHRIRELTQGVVHITSAVERIGAVSISLAVCLEERIKRLCRR